MRLTIAGITCDVNGMSGFRIAKEAEERYAPFIGEGRPDFEVELRVRPAGGGRVVGVEQPVVEAERLKADLYSVRRLDNPFEALVDFAAGRAQADVDDNIYCLDSFLRILYSLLLTRAGGLLLHSAAIAFDGRGGLLVGVSEAGKTTLCRQGFPTVLSDELVAVRRDGEGFRAYGTPFWGEFVPGPVREEAEVAALFLLRKGPRHEVRPHALPSALLEVMGCVFFFGPREFKSDVLRLVGELVESRFVGEFYFVPEPGVVSFLDEELSRYAS